MIPESIFDVFAKRPERFRMLDSGIRVAGWHDTAQLKLLEIGCSHGDGAAYVSETWNHHVTGIDIDARRIFIADGRYRNLISKKRLKFLSADALSIPFAAETFDGIYSEAAFSPIADKNALVKAMHTMLKKGARVLINDFCVQSHEVKKDWKALGKIPCFTGVNTLSYYCALFEMQGFSTISFREDYGEIIRLSMWMRKQYDLPVKAIGAGKSAHISYGQLVFEKR